MLKTRVSPVMQPASTSSVAHPDGATESQTQPPHPSGTRPRAADARLRRLPARQALGRSQSLPVNVRYTAPKPDLHPLIAAARQPRILERLDAMRQRLAELKTDQARGREALGSRDTQFLDLLVAMENARHPELALSLHAIDHRALRDGNPSAVADLAGALATSMRTGKQSWHAILSTNGYQAAVSVRHHAAHPERISLVVVSSAGEMLSEPEWHRVATLLAEGVDKALEQHRALVLENVPSRATVDVHCLHTCTQLISDGEAILALSAAKAMPADKDVAALHQRALADAGERESPVGVRIENDNDYLGPRFFKYMTYPFGTDKLLKKRPAFETQPVNKKTELPLREFQAMHMRPRVPRFGLREQRNTAHETKRLQLYERAIAHLGASVRVDGMAGYLHELQRAHEGGTAPPAPRDAEFLDLLAGVENMLDPQLRLSTHRIDTAKLDTRDPGAIASLTPILAEGLRSGNDWRATLDLGGHHVAVDARHDAEHPTHLSLAVLNGAGSPLSRKDWRNLSRALRNSVNAILQAGEGNGARTGKVWLTHLDISSHLTGTDTALFALRTAKAMRDDPGIAGVHGKALALASSSPSTAGSTGDSGDALIDEGHNPKSEDHALLEGLVRGEQIQLYERAIPYLERLLETRSETH
ncbi:type III effector protein [Ralstonia solanacearum]|nr:type III effector protein [Ralstonia solanacearum]MDB0543855.1 type III effector protein [Ralstonia solanacearum]MDB0552525.1 type III effector protein [Ralstonia solanacearum]MDB0558793.1 type III effector protein [Ralstonia solanacearum]